MSLAKGLEFRAVIVMACDEGMLPLEERVADAADEEELDDIYETERRLLYVACARAREHLLLTGLSPTSKYLADFISLARALPRWRQPRRTDHATSATIYTALVGTQGTHGGLVEVADRISVMLHRALRRL